MFNYKKYNKDFLEQFLFKNLMLNGVMLLAQQKQNNLFNKLQFFLYNIHNSFKDKENHGKGYYYMVYFFSYKPPGTGKTFLAKACASEMGQSSTFLSVSSSDLLSKYVGESEKTIKTLFKMARQKRPCIIFIDEIDSLASTRSDNQNEVSRRVKTEFLVQMQGLGKEDQGFLVLGATNLPWCLDSAIRRRFEKRIYISLPDQITRIDLLKKLLKETPHTLQQKDYKCLGQKTQNYSGSDISTLVREAAYQPLRICQQVQKFLFKQQNGILIYQPFNNKIKNGYKVINIRLNQIKKQQNQKNIKVQLPKLNLQMFQSSLQKTKATVSKNDLKKYQKFTQEFGQQG